METKRKKRLLLITEGFPYGESERGFLPTEFSRLREHFSVHCLAMENDAPLLYPLEDGVQAERFFYRPFPKSVGTALRCVKHLLSPGMLPEFWRASRGCGMRMTLRRWRDILGTSLSAEQLEKHLAQIVQQEQTDIIYTYWCTAATLAAVRLKKKFPHLKVLSRFHRYDLYCDAAATGWLPCRSIIAQGADRLAFISEDGKKDFLAHWGVQWADKTVVAYLGCRGLSAVHPDPRRPVLVSCSLLIPRKRVERIIDALALLPESIRLSWYHIGDGEAREALEQHAADCLGGRQNIRWEFCGFVKNEALPALYQRIAPSLFVTATSSEGVPVSVQEAFSMGVPAVATAVGGIPELVVDGVNGFLLPEDVSAQQIADAIKAYFALSDAQRQAMSNAARTMWQTRFDAQANAVHFTQQLAALADEWK